MPTYRKRKESDILSSILGYLEVLKNLKCIAFADRRNAGKVVVGGGNCPICKTKIKGHYFRGARDGTSDIEIVLLDGVTLWIEVKTKNGQQRETQKEFQKVVDKIPNHHYYIVRSTNKVLDVLKNHGVAFKCP